MDAKELQLLCQSVLQDFHFALFHPTESVNLADQQLGQEKMAYLDEEMVFKVVVLITIVVHKLQSQGERHRLW